VRDSLACSRCFWRLTNFHLGKFAKDSERFCKRVANPKHFETACLRRTGSAKEAATDVADGCNFRRECQIAYRSRKTAGFQAFFRRLCRFAAEVGVTAAGKRWDRRRFAPVLCWERRRTVGLMAHRFDAGSVGAYLFAG